jgi:hypothetical protein
MAGAWVAGALAVVAAAQVATAAAAVAVVRRVRAWEARLDTTLAEVERTLARVGHAADEAAATAASVREAGARVASVASWGTTLAEEGLVRLLLQRLVPGTREERRPRDLAAWAARFAAELAVLVWKAFAHGRDETVEPEAEAEPDDARPGVGTIRPRPLRPLTPPRP